MPIRARRAVRRPRGGAPGAVALHSAGCVVGDARETALTFCRIVRHDVTRITRTRAVARAHAGETRDPAPRRDSTRP